MTMIDANPSPPRDFLGIAAVVFAVAVSLAGACYVIAERSFP
jgi:hypothetical protein